MELRIADLARVGVSADALRAFATLHRLRLTPDRSSFPYALKSCTTLASVHTGCQLHLLALRLGLLPDLFVSSALVDMYSKCFHLDDARKVFDEIPDRNLIVWTSMITDCLWNDSALQAITLFKHFITEEGAEGVDAAAAVTAISACAQVSERGVTIGVHDMVLKVGLDVGVSMGNTLVDAYAKGGELGVSRKVFDEMGDRDVVSWNLMIAFYAQNGLLT